MLVSIILPTFNRSVTLGAAIESVFSQTYTDWELIIIDNYSSDETDSLLQQYRDSRILVKKFHNQGNISNARNIGIEYSSGELIAFLDSDDWWEYDKLEQQVKLFDSCDVGLVYGNYFVYNELRSKTTIGRSGNLPSGWVLNDLLSTNMVGLLTVIIRRVALDQLPQPFNIRYPIIGDFDTYVRLAKQWRFKSTQNPVATYRIHGNNESVLRHNLHVSELRAWIKEMASLPIVCDQPGFSKLVISVQFANFVFHMRNHAFREAFSILLTLPNLRQIIKMLVTPFLRH